ncbi:FeoA domain-containing protein [Lebetimonas sp. JS138]|nr:FeoA domain-containing protein [Lebetimonas sp. JS138]
MGPLLIKAGESRIALGFGLANKIIVEEIKEN